MGVFKGFMTSFFHKTNILGITLVNILYFRNHICPNTSPLFGSEET